VTGVATPVVVTGGSGFLGSNLVEALVRQERQVIVYDPAPLPPDLRCDASAVRHVAADIRDGETFGSVVTPEVDTVFHLSALVGVDNYLSDPLDVIEISVIGMKNVLHAAHAAGAKVVVASTSEIYGRNPSPPWSEDDDRLLGSTSADRWSYATAKAVAEHMTFAYMRHHGLRASILRYFNLYGPRQRPAYVLSRTIHRVLNGQPPLLYDSGRQTRCFTYVDDAVEATLRAASISAADGQSFNVGSDCETSVIDAMRLVSTLADSPLQPEALDTSTALGDAYEDIPRRVPDTSKAKTVLDWKSTTSLQDGLAATIDWARRSGWWLSETPAHG
jgi:dTDP-alpha-D-glucuronic acid decarboxylase